MAVDTPAPMETSATAAASARRLREKMDKVKPFVGLRWTGRVCVPGSRSLETSDRVRRRLLLHRELTENFVRVTLVSGVAQRVPVGVTAGAEVEHEVHGAVGRDPGGTTGDDCGRLTFGSASGEEPLEVRV